MVFTNYVYFIGYQESERNQTTIHSIFTPMPPQPKSQPTAHPQADQPHSIILRSNRQRERENGKQRGKHGRDAWPGEPSAMMQGGIPDSRVVGETEGDSVTKGEDVVPVSMMGSNSSQRVLGYIDVDDRTDRG